MDIALQVEVPSHSHSFEVVLPPGATVFDLKQAINLNCQGQPTVDGQRVISKGRLLNDPEVVDNIWKNDNEARVVFLAVHPSAWTSTPPEAKADPPSSSKSPASEPPYISTMRETLGTFTRPRSHFSSPQPLAYVHYVHGNAIRALTNTPLTPPLTPSDMVRAREWSKMVVESYGHEWPSILNQDFPGSLSTTPAENEGVTYHNQYIEGYPYLVLSPKSNEPTPLQKQALEILQYTFPLLSYTYQPVLNTSWPTYPRPFSTSQRPRDQAPVPPPQNPPRPQLPQFPFRALIAPFLMLCLRTLFLLYIFSPSRTPVIAVIITGWVFWELWGAAQAAMAPEGAGGNQAGGVGAVAGDGPRPNGNGNANDLGNGNNNIGGPNAAPNVVPGIGLLDSPTQLLHQVAEYNLADETRALSSTPTNPIPLQKPSLFHRVKMLVVLLILTIHPAVWLWRRDKLRIREGVVKREQHEARSRREQNGTRNVNDPDQAQNSPPQPQKPAWLQEYIDRVERAEWVDG